MAKSKKQSSKTSKTSVSKDWQDDPFFATIAIESRAQTVAWMLNTINRQQGLGSNLARSEPIIAALDEYTTVLYNALNAKTVEEHDFLYLATAAITFFIAHMIECHDLPQEHLTATIDLLTFYSARFYHNMEPRT
jgi:hypothetical protein